MDTVAAGFSRAKSADEYESLPSFIPQAFPNASRAARELPKPVEQQPAEDGAFEQEAREFSASTYLWWPLVTPDTGT